jgi:hypothetical protein
MLIETDGTENKGKLGAMRFLRIDRDGKGRGERAGSRFMPISAASMRARCRAMMNISTAASMRTTTSTYGIHD